MAGKKKSKKKRWRDAFGASQVVQRMRPEESGEYLHNPHRGTTTFQRFQGDPVDNGPKSPRDTYGPVEFKPAPRKLKPNKDFIPWTALSYCRWPWRWLEPKKGTYNWEIVDGALKAARTRGQALQIRFQPFTEERVSPSEDIGAKRRPPDTAADMPNWYWDTGARWIKSVKNIPIMEPDSNDPLYIKHFTDFIKAFGARYDGHPDLESIDVAYAGHWGESGGNSTTATARKLVDVYVRAFKKTQLLSLLGTHGCKYAGTYTKRPFGWRADCYGDLRVWGHSVVPDGLSWNHMYDAYPKETALNGVTEAWKAAPVTFETCGNVMTWHKNRYDLDWIIEQGYKYHVSVFMPKSVKYPPGWMARLQEFDKKIGYRFVLRQILTRLEAKAGERIKAEVSIDNVGCAPIYRPYKLALRFKQGGRTAIVPLKKDIRALMPGISWFEERLAVPAGLKKGETDVAIGIIDEHKKPVVRLAIKPQDKDGWHTIGKMDII